MVQFYTLIRAIENKAWEETPVQTQSEAIFLMINEMTGAYVPHARYSIALTFMKNAIENTPYAQAHPNLMRNNLTLVKRAKEDGANWPHLKTEFYEVADMILVQCYENRLNIDEAIEVGLLFNDEEDLQILRNALTAICHHQSRSKYLEAMRVNPQVFEVFYSSDKEHVVDYAIALYVEGSVMSAEKLEKEKITELKGICEHLTKKNFMHASFQLIYKLRGQEDFTDYEMLIDWTSKLIEKVEHPSFVKSKQDPEQSVAKLQMEYGVLHVFHGDRPLGVRYLERAAKTYPDAQHALSMMRFLKS